MEPSPITSTDRTTHGRDECPSPRFCWTHMAPAPQPRPDDN